MTVLTDFASRLTNCYRLQTAMAVLAAQTACIILQVISIQTSLRYQLFTHLQLKDSKSQPGP